MTQLFLSSEIGDPSFDGLSLQTPKRTRSSLTVTNGDTINVMPGIYRSSDGVFFGGDNGVSGGIQWVAVQRHTAVIIDDTPGDYLTMDPTNRDFNLDGFIIKSLDASLVNLGSSGTNRKKIFKNCLFVDCTKIIASGAETTIAPDILDCAFIRCGRGGRLWDDINPAGGNFIVDGCLFLECDVGVNEIFKFTANAGDLTKIQNSIFLCNLTRRIYDFAGLADLDAAFQNIDDNKYFGNDTSTSFALTAGGEKNAIAAQGTLTLSIQPLDSDTITVDGKTYLFENVLVDIDGHVQIGGTLANTQANLVSAFDLSGVAGVDYATSTIAHPTVDLAAFAANQAVLTAKVAGNAANAILLASTLSELTDGFDDGNLGATTPGRSAFEVWRDDSGADGLSDEQLPEMVDFDRGLVRAIPRGNLDRFGEGAPAASRTIGPFGVGVGLSQNVQAVIWANPIDLGGGITSQGILTLDTQPTAGDTFLLDAKGYIFEANGALTDVDGNIEIGLTLADSQANLVNAVTLAGTPGTGYAASMTLHPTMTAKPFDGADQAVLEALVGGVVGDALVTTETFAAESNQFDQGTLGLARAGFDSDPVFVGGDWVHSGLVDSVEFVRFAIIDYLEPLPFVSFYIIGKADSPGGLFDARLGNPTRTLKVRTSLLPGVAETLPFLEIDLGDVGASVVSAQFVGYELTLRKDGLTF